MQKLPKSENNRLFHEMLCCHYPKDCVLYKIVMKARKQEDSWLVIPVEMLDIIMDDPRDE